MEFTPKDHEFRICLLHSVDIEENAKSLYAVIKDTGTQFEVTENYGGHPEKLMARVNDLRDALRKYDSLR